MRPIGLDKDRPLTHHEVEVFWELSGSRDWGLRLRFVKEAIREPLPLGQLGRRADFAMQAAVGLDAGLRAEYERILAGRLADPGLTKSQRLDLARAVAGLGDLTPEVAAVAADCLTEAMGETTDDYYHLRDLALALDSVARHLRSPEAAAVRTKATDSLIKAMCETTNTSASAPPLAEGLVAVMGGWRNRRPPPRSPRSPRPWAKPKTKTP